MTQLDYHTADFAYDTVSDGSGLPSRTAVFADGDGVRAQIEQDLSGAGFRTIDGGPVARLLDGPITLLGDLVMVDCPAVSAATFAALARLDTRVAKAGAHLIVSTSFEALDDVFAVLDQSKPQILVEPSRAERLVAAGRVLTNIGNSRVREMSDEDRLGLLHLSRQVDAIAHELDRLSSERGLSSGDPCDRLSDLKREFRGQEDDQLAFARDRARTGKMRLPDPHMVRRLISARQARAKYFDSELFADPAWDMLLDLTAAHAEKQRVSVTSLCIAAGVPATTALRWLKQMVESGVFIRVEDKSDRRRAFIALSDQSKEAMIRYFSEVETPLAHAA